MKTVGWLPPTWLVFWLMWLCVPLSAFRLKLPLGKINGPTEVDLTTWPFMLSYSHPVPEETHTIEASSIEWLLDGQVVATKGLVLPVAASSLQPIGNYRCRVIYTHWHWKHVNVTIGKTREVVVTATFNEQLQLLTPIFVDEALQIMTLAVLAWRSDAVIPPAPMDSFFKLTPFGVITLCLGINVGCLAVTWWLRQKHRDRYKVIYPTFGVCPHTGQLRGRHRPLATRRRLEALEQRWLRIETLVFLTPKMKEVTCCVKSLREELQVEARKNDAVLKGLAEQDGGEDLAEQDGGEDPVYTRGFSPEMMEVIRCVTREEVKAEARKNDAVLKDLPEQDGGEDLAGVVTGLLPDIAGKVLSANRLGQRRGAGQSTIQQETGGSTPDPALSANRPRPVLVKLTACGKSLLWVRRRNLKYNNQRIYVEHHLTDTELKAQRAARPKFKQLRAKQIRCSLPRGQILDRDGQPLSDDRIDALRSSS